MKYIGIRCDANSIAGLGHFMRMLALALRLEARDGYQVVFYMQPPIAHIARQLLATHDFAHVSVPPVTAKPDAALWAAHHGTHPLDMLLIDEPYYYPTETLQAIRKETQLIMVDHPWATRDDCDVLLMPNMHLGPETLETLEHTFGDDLIYGRQYVLLGHVEKLFARRQRFSGLAKRIVFITGGSGLFELLTLVDMTRALHHSMPDVHKVYLLGNSLAPMSLTADVHLESSQFLTGFAHEHIATADLAVCLFGVSIYECLALGVPVLAIGRDRKDKPETATDPECIQQLQIATSGAVRYGGLWTQVQREWLCLEIGNIVLQAGTLKNMHLQAEGQVERGGAQRIAALLHDRLSADNGEG